MEALSLDPSPGLTFESQVRSLMGEAIVSPSPNDATSFWLLAAFSRSSLRLDDHSVGLILQSVLGGQSHLFAVVEVEDCIFKFSVASKNVGLMVYNLKFFQCSKFKVFFHLWNEKGLLYAKKS